MHSQNLIDLINHIEAQLSTQFPQQISNQYAWWLLQYITQKDELTLLTQKKISWSEQDQKTLQEYLEQIITEHKPLSYILGSVPFAGLEILVEPPILIPRPETEEWVMQLIQSLSMLNEPLWILDLCTGSGCIALALADALPKSKIVATDINDKALSLAKKNALHNGITNIEFIKSDLFESISPSFKFNSIVSNPPYIAPDLFPTLQSSVRLWEDKNALICPDEGLSIIKRIVEKAPEYLINTELFQKNNIPQLGIEIDYNQAIKITDYMKSLGYHSIEVQKDLQGNDRALFARVGDGVFKRKKYEHLIFELANDQITCVLVTYTKGDLPLLKKYKQYKNFIFLPINQQIQIIQEFAIHKNSHHTFLSVNLAGPFLRQYFTRIAHSPATISDFTFEKRNTFYGYQYVCPMQNGQHLYYSFDVTHTLLFQIQLLAHALKIPLCTITSSYLSSLQAYQKLYGPAFRASQLSIDLVRSNYQIETIINNTMLSRLLALDISIDIEKEKKSLLTAVGIIYSQKD